MIIKLKCIENLNKFNSECNFILSALNLAFIGYVQAKKINPNKNFIIWPDGVFAVKHGCKTKIPGRVLIRKLKNTNKIKKIIVMGNCSKKELLFLKLKFKLDVMNIKLKFGDFNTIIKSLPAIKKNYLYILTLPTPLQEQVASYISEKFRNFKIICIGGGLKMAAGLEKDCPKLLYKLGLEFIWRLRGDTKRRILRLLYTFIMYNIFIINNKKISIKKII